METIVKFDYTTEQLNIIAEEANKVDLTDLEAVKEAHKKLVTVRTTILKKGKELREGAIKFQKDVIETEKQYLGITVPVENKFKEIIDGEKERILMEARKEMLPQKRAQLELLTHKQDVSDERILGMDDAQWVAFYQEAMTFDQREKQRILDEAESEKKREARDAEIREEERKKLEEKTEKERLEKIRKAEIEEAERASNEKYQAFLIENNYNEVTDRIVGKDGFIRIYRLVAEFKQ